MSNERLSMPFPGEYLMYSDATRPLYQAPQLQTQVAYPITQTQTQTTPDPRGVTTHSLSLSHSYADIQPNHFLQASHAHAVSASPHSPHQNNQHIHNHNHISQDHYHMYGPNGHMPPPSTVGALMNSTYAAAGAGGGGPPGMVQPGMMQHQRPSQYLPQTQNHLRNSQQTPPMNSTYPQPPSAFIAPPSAGQSYYSQAPSSNFNPAYQAPYTASPSSQSQMAQMASLQTSSASHPPPPSFSTPQRQSASPRQPPMQQPPSQQPASSQRPASQISQKPILQPPLSPASAKLESQRVSALLEINRALIQEVIQLQALGRAGAPTSQALAQQQQMLQQQGQATGQASPSRAEGDTDAKKDDGKGKDGSTSTDVAKARTAVSSLEYVNCMRRLQSNLAYLASISDRPHKPVGTIPACPAIMDAPPPVEGNAISDEGMAGLRSQYEYLKSLYPDVGQRQMNLNQMRGVTAGGQGVGGPLSSGGPGGAAGAMRV